MLKPRNALLALLTFLLVVGMSLAAPQSFTGTITDTMCGKKHMIAGKTDAECTRECMKSKGDWTYGLVVGDKVYRISGNVQRFDALAGKRVTVTGELGGDTISVNSISVAR